MGYKPLYIFINIYFIYVGSISEYKIDEDGRFLYFFMALSDSIYGWQQYCRPIIYVDGTSMKNKYA